MLKTKSIYQQFINSALQTEMMSEFTNQVKQSVTEGAYTGVPVLTFPFSYKYSMVWLFVEATY